MDFELRDYQKKDVEFIVKQHKIIDGSEPGTGKTLVALTAAKDLSASSILIICPKISFGVWEQEALKWYNWESTIYTGTPTQRTRIWKNFIVENRTIMITNYAKLAEVLNLRPNWHTIIADEVHQGGLLNHKTVAFKTFKKFKSASLMLLTGTPIRRGPQDLWTLLHLCAPRQFTSYWSFLNQYCIVLTDMYGQHIEGRPKNVPEYNAMLTPYFIRHTKKAVLKDLPDKTRQAIPLELEKEQKRMYVELVNTMMTEAANGNYIVTPNLMTQTLRLRQLLIAPQMLGAKESGIVIEALCDMLIDEFESGRAVTICTPFRQAIPYIIIAISKRTEKEYGVPVPVYQIHGQIREPAATIAQKFQDYASNKKVLIYTIKSGTSFTAHSASTCFFLGYEWSAIENLQAEDRIHRIGQINKVMVYYLLVKGTVDEIVMHKLDEKQMAANWILEPAKMLQQLKELTEGR